jgi:hypothetical protein
MFLSIHCTVCAGLDFENAHEAMVKMAQQASQQQGASAASFPGRISFPGAPQTQMHHMSMMPPGADVYAAYAAAAGGPGHQFAMPGMPPPRPY